MSYIYRGTWIHDITLANNYFGVSSEGSSAVVNYWDWCYAIKAVNNFLKQWLDRHLHDVTWGWSYKLTTVCSASEHQRE